MMVKPTIIAFAISAVMLQKGWLDRYLPQEAHDHLPRSLIIASGYAWSGLIFALGVANFVVAMTYGFKVWAWYTASCRLCVRDRGLRPPICDVPDRRPAKGTSPFSRSRGVTLQGERAMKTAGAFLVGVLVVVATLCIVFRPDHAIRVGTGNAAHTICSETFVSGFDPKEVFAQAIAPYPGLDLLARGMHVDVDRANRSVEVSWHGLFKSRAIYRDKIGCLLLEGAGPNRSRRCRIVTGCRRFFPRSPEPQTVEPSDLRLRAALDRMFAEPANRRIAG